MWGWNSFSRKFCGPTGRGFLVWLAGENFHPIVAPVNFLETFVMLTLELAVKSKLAPKLEFAVECKELRQANK